MYSNDRAVPKIGVVLDKIEKSKIEKNAELMIPKVNL